MAKSVSPTGAGSVQVRQLTPPPPPEDMPGLLYREVPQIVGEPTMKPSFEVVTLEQGAAWLEAADLADREERLKQRNTAERDIARWQILMDTRRFVQYLPDSPLCLSAENGLLMNGRHRLKAQQLHGKPLGFFVVREVPEWMFRFFDNGKQRTLEDVFRIARREMSNQMIGSVMKLGMRYEEFLYSKRPASGWMTWKGQRDESYDVDDFYARRDRLADQYIPARDITVGSKLITSSAMVFRFYQSLAWPEGMEQLNDYCAGLAEGAMLARQMPALVLREWSLEQWKLSKIDRKLAENIPAKRELHLLLLFLHFDMTMKGIRIQGRLKWAKGFPMAMPYHPDGPDVAVANVRAALERMDAEADDALITPASQVLQLNPGG